MNSILYFFKHIMLQGYKYAVDRYCRFTKIDTSVGVEYRCELNPTLGFIGFNRPGCIVRPAYGKDVSIACNVCVYIEELGRYVYTLSYHANTIFYHTPMIVIISENAHLGDCLYVYKRITKTPKDTVASVLSVIDYIIAKYYGTTSSIPHLESIAGRPIPSIFNGVIYISKILMANKNAVDTVTESILVCGLRTTKPWSDDDYIFEVLTLIIYCEFCIYSKLIYSISTRDDFIKILTNADRICIIGDLYKLCKTCDICKAMLISKYGKEPALIYPNTMWDILAIMRYHNLYCKARYAPIYNSDMLRIGQLVIGEVDELDKFNSIYGDKSPPLYFMSYYNETFRELRTRYEKSGVEYIDKPIITKCIPIEPQAMPTFSDSIELTIFPYIPRVVIDEPGR